jgi:hypothetical protein
MVITADDMRDAHVMIVDHHRQHIGGGAVRPQQDEIVQLGVLHRHVALNTVVDRRRALGGRAQADDMGCVGGSVVAIAPWRADSQRLLRGLRLGTHAVQLVLRQVATISVAGLDHLTCHFGMALRPRELIHFLAIPIKAEPAHPVDDSVDRRLGRTGAVGVLDPQPERAAVMACEQQVEQGGTGAAEMQKARGRWRKTGNDLGRGRIIDCAQPRVLPGLKSDGHDSRVSP